MPIDAGTRLGRYELRSRLGAGGMGEVYLAWDSKLERTIALKILPAEVSSDKRRMHRFKLEARAASALNHPNIITIYEIDQIDSTHFIATEFIDGTTLRAFMASRRMKLDEVLDVAIQVASALVAAHAEGIVHRDIKPENLMVRRDGYVKVLDFGLAKLTEHQSSGSEATTLFDTAIGVVIGTVTYMSPEQARGQSIDAQTDIFSLGVVIYEMASGRTPFEGDTASDMIASILKTEPPPLVQYSPDIPDELQRIVERALCKDCGERYQTAKDLLIDLRNLKRELEFEAKLGRSAPSSTGSETKATRSGSQETIETAGKTRERRGKAAPVSTASNAEYLVGSLKRHRIGVIVMITALIVAVASLAYFYFVKSGKTIDSIAVLPFVNTSADPNTEYLSDGITDSLINSLSQLPNLRVMSRNSVFRYKGREIDAQAAGRELNVQAVLTGRVVQHGDTLSINAELVDARDSSHIWGEQYHRKLTDIFTVQEEIAKEISERLRLRLSGEEKKRLTKRYTENTEAYQLYLKGRYYWNKRTGETLQKGVEHFQQAIEKDPGYALAYAGLADSYILLGVYNVLPPKEAYPLAKTAATRALEMDETLAEAHVSLASVMGDYEWDRARAEREFTRAIELNPNYATAHQWYAELLSQMGRHKEALTQIKQARELDPLSLIINSVEGWLYYLARQPDQAIEQCRKVIEMDQNFSVVHVYLGRAFAFKGEYEQAIAELQKAIQLDEDPWTIASLGHTYAIAGKREEALKLLSRLKELSTRRHVSPYHIAAIHAGLNEKEQAFQWLEKAYKQREQSLIFLKVDPLMDNLRSDSRFADLLRRVGFEP
ncbi:MAG: protein kinase [Pyrinomonadaceae bacterium]